ncbi:MAG: cbb3-type cytochrome c oxidase subunit I [Chloroflexi bacterium]|nr:cbb3-type cytochrome c oxidase subunit I [Chloroflexota bacterium]
MSKTTLGFIYSGLVYLLVGITLGVLFLIFPEMAKLRFLHVHSNLVGFVIFLIFGVGYHILPRFRGRPLHSEKLAWFQLWMANLGLAGLLISNVLVVYGAIPDGKAPMALFGVLLVVSVYLFIYNMARTLVPVVQKPGPRAPAAK